MVKKTRDTEACRLDNARLFNHLRHVLMAASNFVNTPRQRELHQRIVFGARQILQALRLRMMLHEKLLKLVIESVIDLERAI